jgi:hypothetical protein
MRFRLLTRRWKASQKLILSIYWIGRKIKMKTSKSCGIGFFLVVLFLTAASVRAELLTTQHGIHINDDTVNESFFVFFNDIFGTKFTASDDAYNAYGVSPYTTWTVSSDSQLSVGGRSFTGFDNTLYFTALGGESTKINTVSSYGGNGFMDFSINSALNLPAGSGFDFQLGVNHTDMHGNQITYTLGSNPESNAGGDIHMLALNITELYNAKYGSSFETVYMFLWEDYKDGTNVWWWNDRNPANMTSGSDWDYTDYVFIMTNVNPDSQVVVTPEPATLAIFGLGLAGLGIVRAHRRRENRGLIRHAAATWWPVLFCSVVWSKTDLPNDPFFKSKTESFRINRFR